MSRNVAEGLQRPWAAGQRANDGDGERLQSSLDRPQADLHRTLGAILAAHVQSLPATHRSGSAFIAEAKAMGNVLQAKPLWYEQLHKLIQQVFGSVPEETAHSLTRQLDATRLIDDHPRIGGAAIRSVLRKLRR